MVALYEALNFLLTCDFHVLDSVFHLLTDCMSEVATVAYRERCGWRVELTNWFIKLVFPTPLSPRIITYSLISNRVLSCGLLSSLATFSRTFFLEDMAGYIGALRGCV